MANTPNLPGQEPHQSQEESAAMGMLSNALAIVGFIILAVIVVWGLIHLVSLTRFSFGSLFSSSPTVQITLPQRPASGQPATISWKTTSAQGGSFAFLYGCEQEFAFATAGQSGPVNRVPCGTSIAVGSSTAATMIPEVSGTSSVQVPFSVVFTPADGSAKITATATMTVAPVSAAATSTPAAQPNKTVPAKTQPAKTAPISSPAPKQNYSPVAHAASGPADLSVSIIAEGYIDPASGALLMNRAPQYGDIVGVEFDIANVGGSASGAYYFQAHLPTTSIYTYTSPAQASLSPGAHVVSTLRFTQLAPGGGIFTVVVNASDANAADNEAAVTIY